MNLYLQMPQIVSNRKRIITATTISGNTLDLTGYPYIPAFDGESYVANGRAISKLDGYQFTRTYFAPSNTVNYGSNDILAYLPEGVIRLGYYIDGVAQTNFFNYLPVNEPFAHLEFNGNFGGATIPRALVEPLNRHFYTVINSDAYNGGSKLYNVKTFGIASSTYIHLYSVYIDGSLGGYVLGTSNNQAEAISTSLTFTPSNVEYIGEGIVISEIDFTGEMDAPTNNSPYNPGGTSGPAGGGGNFGRDEPSDDVSGGISNGSSDPDSSDSGIYTRYVLTIPELRRVGNRLFNQTLLGQLETMGLSLLYASPMESIISLMSYPFDVEQFVEPGGTRSSLMWWGNATFLSDSEFKVLEKSSGQIDWGTINISEFWGSFLDYSPFTKMELYLPWGTGFVPIDPNECTPGTLQVVTNVELDKGTYVHNVISTVNRNGVQKKLVIGSYSGVCAKQIPLTSLDMSGKATQLATLAIAAASTVSVSASGISGYATQAGTPFQQVHHAATAKMLNSGAGGTTLDTTLNVASSLSREDIPRLATQTAMALASPAHMNRNGAFTSSAAGMGVQYPYLVISRPSQSVPTNYGHHYGYPSNIYTQLSMLSGYTEIGSIHLDGIICTEDEKDELLRTLKGGVIF